jgi:UDP-N-acetylmuramyl tripeptide synthase
LEVLDSRRLTGPNILTDRPAAIIDVRLEAHRVPAFVDAWRARASAMLAAVGWDPAELLERRTAGGVSLGFPAPIDALYAATEINDWACEAARRQLDQGEQPALEPAAARLRELIGEERNPRLLRLAEAAAARDVPLLHDDDHASLGLGIHSQCWPVRTVPAPDAVPWERYGRIPVGLVTGTNGKTTTVRLAAAMARAAGYAVGTSSTDRIAVDDDVIDRGDYSGPNGARMVLRDPRVQLAVLETARGGLLRRGVALRRADAAVVTNIAADHLDDFGVTDLDSLADVKWLVTTVLGKTGTAILNVEDARLRRRAPGLECPITWFGLDAETPPLAAHIEQGGRAWTVIDDHLVRFDGGCRTDVVPVADVPLTLGGAARNNTANCMAAAGLAEALGVPLPAIRRALRGTLPAANPGRCNLFEVNGAHVLVDFAHNPHGVQALADIAGHLGRGRRLLLIGQAGDRNDQAIIALAEAAWTLRPDRILLKEMGRYARGRAPGEVAALLRKTFIRRGADPDTIDYLSEELDGVREALAWAGPGDLVIMLIHERINDVLALVQAAAR